MLAWVSVIIYVYILAAAASVFVVRQVDMQVGRA